MLLLGFAGLELTLRQALQRLREIMGKLKLTVNERRRKRQFAQPNPFAVSRRIGEKPASDDMAALMAVEDAEGEI